MSLLRSQDLYEFVRGYYEYLSVNGIETEYNRDAHATDAAVFGVDSTLGDTTSLFIGQIIEYKGKEGRLIEFGTLPTVALTQCLILMV